MNIDYEVLAWVYGVSSSFALTAVIFTLLTEGMKDKKPSKGLVISLIVLSIIPGTSSLMATLITGLWGKALYDKISPYLNSPFYKEETHEE